MADDTIQIDLNADISGAVAARKALEQVEQEVKQLKAAMNAGAVTLDAYLDGMDQLKARQDALSDAIGKANGALGTIGQSFSVNTQKLSVFAGLLDDLQYVPQQGLRPILNNLTQISPAVAIAGIGFQALLTHVNDLGSAFGASKTLTEAEAMEELGKKAHLTADEYERLARYKGLANAVQAIREGRPEAEKTADERTTKAIVEAGGKDVIAGLLKNAPELVARSGDVPKAQADLDENAKYIADREKLARDNLDPQQRQRAEEDAAAAKARRPELQQALLDAQRDAAEKLVASSTIEQQYAGARKRLIEAIERDAAAFGPNSAQLLADLKAIEGGRDPEQVRKEAGGADNSEEAIDQGVKAADEAIKAFTKSVDEGAKAEQEAQREGDRQNKASEQYQEQRAKQLAGPLQDRYNRAAAGGQGFDEQRIQEELVKGGLSEDGAGRFAAKVRENLAEAFDEKVRITAGERGLDQDGAKRAMLQESNDKMLADARKSAEKAEAERRERGLASLTRTDEGRGYRNILARSLMTGDTPEKADARASGFLAQQLQGQGMGERDAKLEADRMVGEDSRRMREAMADTQAKFGRLGRDDKPEAPEHIAAADFTNKVESSGADKTNQLQEAGNKLLADLKDKMDQLIRKPNTAVFGPILFVFFNLW